MLGSWIQGWDLASEPWLLKQVEAAQPIHSVSTSLPWTVSHAVQLMDMVLLCEGHLFPARWTHVLFPRPSPAFLSHTLS